MSAALDDDPSPPITLLLQRVAAGERDALDAVFAALYPDLRRIARARLHDQGRGDGLSTTTLVHESFLKLAQAAQLELQDRKHFFTYAAKAMRHIIIDEAREQQALRRGGAAPHLTLDEEGANAPHALAPGADVNAVHEALHTLETLDPELAAVVEMRYFGGYSELEIGELLGVNERTVRRRWDKARAWLYLQLQRG